MSFLKENKKKVLLMILNLMSSYIIYLNQSNYGAIAKSYIAPEEIDDNILAVLS